MLELKVKMKTGRWYVSFYGIPKYKISMSCVAAVIILPCLWAGCIVNSEHNKQILETVSAFYWRIWRPSAARLHNWCFSCLLH